MIVMKFGGTSVGSAESMRRAASIVAGRKGRAPLVVVSAAAGVTNRLLAAAEEARERRESRMLEEIAWIAEREREILAGLELPGERAQAATEALEAGLRRLEELTRGVYLLGECTPRSLDAIAAMGEILSYGLMTETLRAAGIEAEDVDPRTVMATDERFGEARPEPGELRRRCEERLAPLLARGTVPVTGGFVGADSSGVTTTLGRGGSDYSATLFGAALGAEEVEIWTDVDGMMTADPAVVPEARVLSEVTFQEASELAYFGAKVLHPATIRPAVERGIPVRILNTRRPEGRGTVVRDASQVRMPERPHLRAVAWKNGIATLAVTSSRMLGAHGFLARLFEVFDRNEVPVDLVTTSEVSVSMTVDRPRRLPAVAEELAAFCRGVRVEEGMSLVCLVGHRLLAEPSLVGEVLAELEGLPLRMLCLGSTDINLSLVLEEGHAAEAIRRLHRRFLEEEAA